MTFLIAIPTLNEQAHIRDVIAAAGAFVDTHDCIVVVADGGSDDATRQIVTELAQERPWLHLLHNPDKLQSSAVNRVAEAFGEGRDFLIRLDAHSLYPAGFIETLIAEARQTQADSVVVSMVAEGKTPLQSLIATAQNSRFGNGGSAHRNTTDGTWVEHGHHALFRLKAFLAVGGYDPTFSHNEDAELDYRLAKAGYRIWLTGKTHLTYLPRNSLRGLSRQYRNFGRGRAATLEKHALKPARRQQIVIALLPALLLGFLAPLTIVALLPLLVWLAGLAVAGVIIAKHEARVPAFLAGPIAGLMQLSWSIGFWQQRLSLVLKKR